MIGAAPQREVRAFWSAALLSSWVVTLVLVVGCKDDRKKVTTEQDVLRCERGVEAAVHMSDVNEASRTYYRQCAGVYTEPECRDAFGAAADMEVGERLPYVAEACRQVYCPALASKGLNLCMGGWLENGRELLRDWGRLNSAIIEYDAGGLAPRVTKAMIRFYAYSRTGPRARPAAEVPR